MKRLLALILCITLSLSLFAACGNTGDSTAITEFSVGYAKADITPTDPVPLRGYGDAMERISEGYLEPMYATCVAFADTEGEIVLLISHDLTNSDKFVFDTCRKQISEETGIPVSHILFTASHCHSAPDYSQDHPNIAPYLLLVWEQVLKGAKEAIADLKPATMETGFTRVDDTNSVRHCLLANGTYQGHNLGPVPQDQFIGHATKVDNLLQVVKFTRKNDKDVILVNWCGHPKAVDKSIYYMAGPNYPGILRSELEAMYDCEVSFVLSGSGNVNNHSHIDGEFVSRDYVELGKHLASNVSNVIENSLTPGKLDKIQLSENLWKTPNKDGSPITVPLYAFSIGDWACVTAPFEIFDTNAMAVRDASQFKMTFYASCANEAQGYLPTPASYSWAITYEAPISKYPAGTAELLQEQLIGQLSTIFAASGNEVADKGDDYNTPEFIPASDGATYLNPSPGKPATAVANGFYHVVLYKNGTEVKNMLCIDEATSQKVAAAAEMELILNEQNVIVDVIAK
ncbi:MAG: hypothetical protein IKU07_03225 [Oscillospiraceae bacterium]|nr:hypothetical protein [Oscillospiraceae bacterium]